MCCWKLVLAAVLCAATSFAHEITINGPVMSPDEGLLLGNGDLSVSVYQTANNLVFRLGKGDVWDRRFDYSKQKKPATADEIIDGVLNYGWKLEGWNPKIEDVKKLPKGDRLWELTRHGSGTPLKVSPLPTPKPTGELRFGLPVDLGVPEKLVQKLFIEEGRATFDFTWKNGITARFEAVVDPELNVLAVEWQVDGWNAVTRLTDRTPIFASVCRWADPDYETWVQPVVEDFPGYMWYRSGFYSKDVKPLPPPEVVSANQIEQRFYPDPLFPKGFVCRLTLDPLEPCGKFVKMHLPGVHRNAEFHLCGEKDMVRGSVALAVTTSRDQTLVAPKTKTFAEYRESAATAAKAYWAKSSFSMPKDAFLENLWYSTYHARRCILKPGTVPPGLFFPSSVSDYSPWNGDYHGNYNMHSIYWGDFAANRLDQAETFMDAVDFSVPIGRKIAKDYYGCRGVFFQLEGFPCLPTEDYNGVLPLGRMAYVTGWMMNHYWEYYAYTRDRAWLKKRGYPMMKDVALFYLDFLKKAPSPKLPPELKDGKYHLFPSVGGESDFRNPMGLCDNAQVVKHCRHALWGAIESAKILNVDAELRAQWQDRLDNLVGADRLAKLSPYARYCELSRSPDDGEGTPWTPAPKWNGTPARRYDNYLGISHWHKMGQVRSASCIPERDFVAWRKDLMDWTHANGIVWGMAIRSWQRTGCWTESLSCMAPFQEMLLQSWDGAIRMFPRWPMDRDAAFENWRAQGAFLVSAKIEGGRVSPVRIFSEKGERCLFWGEWTVTDDAGGKIAVSADEFGRRCFATKAGMTYWLRPLSDK